MNDVYLSEKKMKQLLEQHLISLGWQPNITWSYPHGIDIEANQNKLRWIIEVKSPESSDPKIINCFVSVLGELLQRMDDPACKYSIALPDIGPFRRLWERLPQVVKRRTGITLLLVGKSGNITEFTG